MDERFEGRVRGVWTIKGWCHNRYDWSVGFFAVIAYVTDKVMLHIRNIQRGYMKRRYWSGLMDWTRGRRWDRKRKYGVK